MPARKQKYADPQDQELCSCGKHVRAQPCVDVEEFDSDYGFGREDYWDNPERRRNWRNGDPRRLDLELRSPEPRRLLELFE